MGSESPSAPVCRLPPAYRLWRRLSAAFARTSAKRTPLRPAFEWPVRLAAVLLGAISGFRFPRRAVGGWWWIWRYRFEMLVGWYQLPTSNWMRKLLREGATAVDVGAHIGYFTRLMGKAIGPTGHVIAFEPSPENFPLLTHNVRRAGLRNVACSQLALADRVGAETLYVSPGHSNHSLVEGYTESQERVQVAVTTLDVFLEGVAAPPLSLVKIDAEGAEPRILQGMSRVISDAPDIVLVVEVNPRALECAGSSPPELIESLEALGLLSRLIDADGNLVEPRGQRFDDAPNLLCMRKHMWTRLAEKARPPSA